MIDPHSLNLLLGPQGHEALAEAQAVEPKEADFLPLFQRLARKFPEKLAHAAVEQAILRHRAKAKFSTADKMYFTREALEQATPEPVAQYRAERFKDFHRIFDLGCGIGGDTLALARFCEVVAVDLEMIRLLLLRANARALGLSHRITPLLADLSNPAWRIPDGSGIFFDPARRTAGRRIRSVDHYQPPLEKILATLPSLDALAVKVSPAVEIDQLEDLDSEVEFISWKGQLREATLWFGGLKSALSRATLLPGPHTLVGDSEPSLPIKAPQSYLYEPDPAVLRAGLVRTLGRRIGASQIDPTIAFLTADKLLQTPFAKAFRVDEVLPFGLKRLRAALRSREVGRVTLKKRGSAVDTEIFERQLNLRGPLESIVILTRVSGHPVAIIVEPV